MKCIARGAALAALLLAAGTHGVSAQEAREEAGPRRFFTVGAGATLPLGEFKDEGKAGFLTGVGIGSGIGSGNLFLLGSAFYGRNGVSEEGHEDDYFALRGGTVNLGLMGSGEGVRPYGYVGLGVQRVEEKGEDHSHGAENETFGNAAVGLSFGRGSTRVWVQGGAVLGGEHAYLPVSAGVSIGF